MLYFSNNLNTLARLAFVTSPVVHHQFGPKGEDIKQLHLPCLFSASKVEHVSSSTQSWQVIVMHF